MTLIADHQSQGVWYLFSYLAFAFVHWDVFGICALRSLYLVFVNWDVFGICALRCIWYNCIGMYLVFVQFDKWRSFGHKTRPEGSTLYHFVKK